MGKQGGEGVYILLVGGELIADFEGPPKGDAALCAVGVNPCRTAINGEIRHAQGSSRVVVTP